MGKVNESVASKFVFLLYLGEAGREGDLAALSNPSASVPGDVRQPLDVILGFLTWSMF